MLLAAGAINYGDAARSIRFSGHSLDDTSGVQERTLRACSLELWRVNFAALGFLQHRRLRAGFQLARVMPAPFQTPCWTD
jgi:hypothetical protein